MSDGRNIDSRSGALSGEGAQQRGESLDRARAPVFLGDPSQQMGLTTGDATYYDRPVIKKSVWTWMIPAYYYVGGATGASAVLGAAATLIDRESLPNLAIRSRWIAVGGSLVSTVFLIVDLGRPLRFLNMLRVFRPTSPMNMGSWILVSFGGFTSVGAFAELGPPSLRRLGDQAAVMSGLFGLGLAGYTGVLVGNTVVPIWQRANRILPVLFVASAMASGASLIDLLGANPREYAIARRFGVMGKVAELGAAMAVERAVESVPEVARPLNEGVSGFLWQAGKALSAASLVVSLFAGRSKSRHRIAGVLGTLGAVCVRFGIHHAGQQSALNPRATFHQQRHDS